MKDLIRKQELAQYYLYYFMEQLMCQKDYVGKFGQKKNELAERFRERLAQMDDQEIVPVDTYNSLDELSHEDLLKKYIGPGVPVIIKGGAKEWGATKKWDLEFFRENYSETLLPFLPSKGEGEAIYEERRVDEICREIQNGSRKYVKFSNFLLKNKEMLKEFDVKQIEKINSVKYHPSSVQLFMGGAGTKTTIHTALSNVTFVQVHGTKRWLTLPKEWTPVLNPIVDHEPQLMADDYIYDIGKKEIEFLTRKMPFKEVLLEPGDIYFNPAYLWHHVENVTTSIGVAFRWISYKAIMRSPVLTSLVLLSQLPFSFKMTDHTKGNYFPNRWP